MNAVESPTPKTMLWSGRILSGLIVLLLLFDAVTKIMQAGFAVDATVELGYPESVVAGIGVALLVSTALYAIPRTSVLGAILLTGYLGGATASHVRVEDPAFAVAFSVVFGVLVWLGLFLRDGRLRQLIPLRRQPAAKPK